MRERTYGTVHPGSRILCNAAADSKGRFYVFGGFGYNTLAYPVTLNDVWRIQLNSNTWIVEGGYSNGCGSFYAPYPAFLSTQTASPISCRLFNGMSLAYTPKKNISLVFTAGYFQDSSQTYLFNDVCRFFPDNHLGPKFPYQCTNNVDSIYYFGRISIRQDGTNFCNISTLTNVFQS